MSFTKLSQRLKILEKILDISLAQRRLRPHSKRHLRHQYKGGMEQSISESKVRLSSVATGCRCRVCTVRIHDVMRRRLMDLGLVPDAEVLVLRRAPLNDPIEVRIANAYVALRREEAERIEVVLL